MTAKKDLEKALEYKAISYAAEKGWIPAKLEKCGRGWPDRIFFGPDESVLIVEFKRPGEKARKQQLAVHRRLSALGFDVLILDSLDEFQRHLNAISD